MHSRRRVERWAAHLCGEAGSATAEFAVLLPAIALTLVLGLGLLQLGSIQVRLTDAAADAARLIGRGQDASSRVSSAQLGATMAVSHDGPLVCVTVSAAVSATGAGSAVVLTGTGCALDDSQAPPS